MTTLEVLSRSSEQTQDIGRAIGSAAAAGDLYLLMGPLGAGKTCLAQGILWGLGVEDYARSPTFVLVSEHRGRLPLYHVDLYRMETATEVQDLGLEEYLVGDGVCVVEWADRAPEVFPRRRLEVRFEYVSEDQRRLSFAGRRGEYDGVLAAIASAASRA